MVLKIKTNLLIIGIFILDNKCIKRYFGNIFFTYEGESTEELLLSVEDSLYSLD